MAVIKRRNILPSHFGRKAFGRTLTSYQLSPSFTNHPSFLQATRLNWYRDSTEWKPFHHDAAAVKPDKAKTQNFTVAVSFGMERDAAFEHAQTKTVTNLVGSQVNSTDPMLRFAMRLESELIARFFMTKK